MLKFSNNAMWYCTGGAVYALTGGEYGGAAMLALSAVIWWWARRYAERTKPAC